ncbi:MAG: 2-oxo acid dehydrogenase subunit E2 [Flavobacteriaceae bacterium]|nr:2-oxo acid dehydrogenase subunit E2 [Flavobacteriaceae bacterium]
MAKFELKLPKMGESVAEATVTNWLKKVGDKIEQDEAVLEIATDKVDSEVPSEVSGTLVEILFQVDDVVQVGQTIAIIETEGGAVVATPVAEVKTEAAPVAEVAKAVEVAKETVAAPDFSNSDKFYSPLVKNIAKEEGISIAELDGINGTGKDGRVTKEDILGYIKTRGSQASIQSSITSVQQVVETKTTSNVKPETNSVPTSVNGEDEIVEMDRMRKLISKYMVETFTPIFMEVVAKALKDFPGMNIQVDGEYIIKKKNINLGMAAALPNGNLIVPVIKNADQLNLVGMAKQVNDLANRARTGKLKPDDTQGGTYTVTNVGTFGSVFGTPIINQPQVGILALGAIRKVPAVIETPEGDFIGIRQKMFLSHSYDHRVVDGALGGSFVKRVADYLEAWDINREV